MEMDDELNQAQVRAAANAYMLMRESLQETMQLRSGRRLVWYVLEQCGIFRTSLSSDPLMMAAAEGKRSFGLQLMAQVIDHCPELYDQMAREQRETENEGNHERN